MNLIPTSDNVISSPIDIMRKVLEYYLYIDRNRAVFDFDKRYSLKYTLSKYEGMEDMPIESLKSDIKSDLLNILNDLFEEYDVDVDINIKDNRFKLAIDMYVIVNGHRFNLNRISSLISDDLKNEDLYLTALENYIRR